MTLTFPHMGNVTISVKALLDELKLDYVLPLENTAQALETGTRLVPEGACFPLKICVGTLLEACRSGADTILMISGLGPCRFGYYCQMQKEILAEAGYETKAIHIKPPRGNIKQLYTELAKLFSNSNVAKFAWCIQQGSIIANGVDELERMYFYIQPREKNKGETDACYKAFKRSSREAKGVRETLLLVEKTKKIMRKIEIDKNKSPLRVGLVGEIYDVIDPFSSLYLQEKLGRMGAEVIRPLSISAWLSHLSPFKLHNDRYDGFEQAAQPYLKTAIGGHAQETLGHSVLMAKDGLDGIIQLFPMGCMPEIVVEGIMPSLSTKENIPVMSLVLDEMTAEAGIMTRAEAFMDLLTARRERKNKFSA